MSGRDICARLYLHTSLTPSSQPTELIDTNPDSQVFLPCDETTKAKYNVREWTFEAIVSPDGASVDAGDDVHVGTFQSTASGASFDGIRWKDGNKWTFKIPEPEGPDPGEASSAVTEK